MNHIMTPASSRTSTRKGLDALIALPLAQFRRAMAHLTADELAALEARIGVQIIRRRWEQGGSHGIERHRSTSHLGLLARRQTETRRAIGERRRAAQQVIPFPQPEEQREGPLRPEQEPRAA
jgi:hypothetical protein